MDVIQQLKENCRPFGLMSEEMQEKAREIEEAGFERFCPSDNGTWRRHDMTGLVFLYDVTYRLRPDYADECEIDECEILPPDDEGIKWVRLTPNHTMDFTTCEMHKDFIGFKFEDGMVRPSPIVYERKDGHKDSSSHISCITLSETADTVLHATHVLFRRKKQE